MHFEFFFGDHRRRRGGGGDVSMVHVHVFARQPYSATPHPLAGERKVPRPLDESAGWKRRSRMHVAQLRDPLHPHPPPPPPSRSYLLPPPPPPHVYLPSAANVESKAFAAVGRASLVRSYLMALIKRAVCEKQRRRWQIRGIFVPGMFLLLVYA